MYHIWACGCGHEWKCSPDDIRIGAVVECPNCLCIWANVRPKRGGNKWIELDRSIATSPYYDLLSEPEEE